VVVVVGDLLHSTVDHAALVDPGSDLACARAGAGGLDGDHTVGRDRSEAEADRRPMTLADAARGQHEAGAAVGGPVGQCDDRGIAQRCPLGGVLVGEGGAEEQTVAV
jgi:hypothetical protein